MFFILGRMKQKNFCFAAKVAKAEQKVAARIATGTLTLVQHKQRIGAASLKVSSRKAELVQRLRDSPMVLMPTNQDAGSCPPAKKQQLIISHARRSVLLLMLSCCPLSSLCALPQFGGASCDDVHGLSEAMVRYVTYTFSSDGMCCPGFMHIQNCLTKLVQIAKLSQRVAILPPPWLLLHRDHNYSPLHDPAPIDESVEWTRYLDLSDLISANTVADPATHPRVHVPTADGHGATVSGAALVEPDTPWTELRDHNASLVAITFHPKWGAKKRRTTDCHNSAVGALNMPSTPSAVGLDKPSKLVLQTADAIAARIEPYVVLHVRRGRAITSASARARTDYTRTTVAAPAICYA